MIFSLESHTNNECEKKATCPHKDEEVGLCKDKWECQYYSQYIHAQLNKKHLQERW